MTSDAALYSNELCCNHVTAKKQRMGVVNSTPVSMLEHKLELIIEERSSHPLITWDEVTGWYYIHNQYGEIVYKVPLEQEHQAKLFEDAHSVLSEYIKEKG